jgi:hypothetical protein
MPTTPLFAVLGVAAMALGALAAEPARPFSIRSAHAAPKPVKRKLRCVHFEQTLQKSGEDIDLQIRSTCKFDVVCSMAYKLTCELDDEVTSQKDQQSTTLETGEKWTLTASTAFCPEGDWNLSNVVWSCDRAGEP